jgi:hypothetical protein
LQERRVITSEESLLHKKKIFFQFCKKQLPLTLSKKKQRPITIVPWHLDKNYIIFRNVENLKIWLFSKKKKLWRKMKIFFFGNILLFKMWSSKLVNYLTNMFKNISSILQIQKKYIYINSHVNNVHLYKSCTSTSSHFLLQIHY